MCVCVHMCCNRQGQEHCEFCSLPQKHAEPDAKGNTTPNNNKVSVLSIHRNAPAGISPTPSAFSQSTGMAGRDGKRWEHPTPPKRGTAEPGPSLWGAVSRRAQRLRVPMGHVPPARRVQLLTSPRAPAGKGGQRAGEPQPASGPATPGDVPSASQTAGTEGGYSCRLGFCQQGCLLGHCPGPPMCPGRGVPGPPRQCQPLASPSHGQGRGTGSLLDLRKPKAPKAP